MNAVDYFQERERLRDLIKDVAYPSSLKICIKKTKEVDLLENKHVLNHHVGSWSFMARPYKNGQYL